MEFTNNFISMLGKQESPAAYLRWSVIAGVGAAIGRNAFIRFGPENIYPNQYIILMGAPGSRKSTGIKLVSRIMKEAGYDNFAPTKSRKEAMWDRLAKISHGGRSIEEADNLANIDPMDVDVDDLLGSTNNGQLNGHSVANMFIVAPEWIDFIGQDEELINNLTNLWDNLAEWDYPRTTKHSIYIHAPTLSMIGGATPSSFTKVIPASALSGGFMRRLLLIHGQQPRKVFWPDALQETLYAQFIDLFKQILSLRNNELSVSAEGMKILLEIYMREHFLDDPRFDFYVGVRYTHLLKLCIISAVARNSTLIEPLDIIQSNTILSRAEVSMPQALGHFGMARNSTAANAVLDIIKRSRKPIELSNLYRLVGADVGSKDDLKKLIDLLVDTHKVKRLRNKQGVPFYVPHINITQRLLSDPYFDQSFLTEEEKI